MWIPLLYHNFQVVVGQSDLCCMISLQVGNLIRLLSFCYQLTRLEEEKLSLTKTVSELASSKETLSKEVEELLGKNQSLEKKLTSSKGQV